MTDSAQGIYLFINIALLFVFGFAIYIIFRIWEAWRIDINQEEIRNVEIKKLMSEMLELSKDQKWIEMTCVFSGITDIILENTYSPFERDLMFRCFNDYPKDETEFSYVRDRNGDQDFSFEKIVPKRLYVYIRSNLSEDDYKIEEIAQRIVWDNYVI